MVWTFVECTDDGVWVKHCITVYGQVRTRVVQICTNWVLPNLLLVTGQQQTVNHIVDTFPLMKFKGGFQLLHEAEEDAVKWPESTSTTAFAKRVEMTFCDDGTRWNMTRGVSQEDTTPFPNRMYRFGTTGEGNSKWQSANPRSSTPKMCVCVFGWCIGSHYEFCFVYVRHGWCHFQTSLCHIFRSEKHF